MSSSRKMLMKWLSGAPAPGNKYMHLYLKEDVSVRGEAVPELVSFLLGAHEDAIQMLREGWTKSLDPLGAPDPTDPAKGYPGMLPPKILMGYFGEAFCGLVAEQFTPFQEKWEVPCYLFRIHNQAFEELERWKQTGTLNQGMIGRTGDDCLAFQRNDKGIIRSLVFEAKCYSSHNATVVAAAHKNLSANQPVPTSTLHMIQVLKESARPDAKEWIKALQSLRFQPLSEYERDDCFVYVCGQVPANYQSMSTIHPSYTGGRRLAAVEAHIDNLPDLVEEVYREVDNAK